MKIRKRIILSATVFAVTASLSAHGRLDVNKQLDYCVEHISLSLKSLSRGGAIDYSKSPKDILKGQHCWNLQNNTPGAWTWGFWPGILWMDYSYTKDEKVKAEAEKFTHSLNYLSHRPAYDHDLGFLVFLSYEKAYNETGDKTYKKTIINTAERLASLYNPKVGTILSWPHEAMDKGRYQPYNK